MSINPKNYLQAIVLVILCGVIAFAQTAAPTPTPDNRGLGIEKSATVNNAQTGQQAREAKRHE